MGKYYREISLFGAEFQTPDSIQRMLRGSETHRRGRVKTVPRLVCADGFSISAQGSDFHRCEPRSLNGPYAKVECACPSKPEPALMPYLLYEDGIALEQSTYNYVPTTILVDLINAHGGLVL